MADQTYPRTNPRVITPDRDASLHPNRNPAGSLVEELGEVADDMRQIYTDLGVRPYRVWSVVVRWTGGAVGKGEQEIVSDVELLPTPMFGMRLTKEVKAGGTVENGKPELTQISPRFTEDDVNAIFHRQPLPQGTEGFIEIRMDARDGNSKIRRFTVYSAPERRASKFDWRVQLVSAYPDPNRNGRLPDVTQRR